MFETLTNPIYWQGFATAWVVFLPVMVLLLAMTGSARQGRPNPGYRQGDRAGAKGQRSRRSEMRGGPR